GVLEIRARVHLGHGHEAEAWVLELPLDEHRDLFFDQLVDPLEPLALHGLRSLPRAYAYYRKLLYLSARLAFGCASPGHCGVAPTAPRPVRLARSSQNFHVDVGDPAVDVVLDEVHGLGDDLVGVAGVAGHAGQGERRALPHVVMIDLGDRDLESPA